MRSVSPAVDNAAVSTRGLPRLRTPRNAEFTSLLETFLITAIATVLFIRTQLWLTNYPQLGGGGLHIAHLLYGGIFMAIAIGVLLMFLGRSPRRPAALLGGVGFGFFIDELGKFVTADNNYFYKPAAGVIYVVFMLIFLIIRYLSTRRDLSTQERAANAVYLAIDATHGRLHERERLRAVTLLDEADQRDPIVAPMRTLLGELRALPTPPPRFYERWGERLQAWYLRISQWPGLRRAITAVIVLWVLNGVLTVIGLVLQVGARYGKLPRGLRVDDFNDLSFLNIAITAGTAISIAFMLAGLVRLRRDRLGAYRRIERGLLISILVTHVFVFVRSQFGAVFGLGIDIALLIALRSMIHAEEGRPDTAPGLIDRPASDSPASTPPLAAPGTPPP